MPDPAFPDMVIIIIVKLNYLIYKKIGENKTFVGTLTPQAMLDITGVKDEEVRTEFTAMIDALSEATDDGMEGTVEYVEIEKLTM